MLWLDSEPAGGLELKISRAVKYYQQRFGRLPNLCFVHPSLLEQANDDPPIDILGIDVLPSQRLEPEQLWLGYREEEKAIRAAA